MVPPWQQIRQRITLFPLADALVREWRAGALEKAIEALLCEVDCTGLTSDVIARRLGVAKGSVRLTRDAVDAAIGRSLDEWERQLLTPKTDVSDEPVIEACRALFATARSGRRGMGVAFLLLGREPLPECLEDGALGADRAGVWLRCERGRAVAGRGDPGSGEL